jgi:hypothetical protein
MAPNGLALLRPINHAEAPFADLFQKFVTANEITDLLLSERQLASGSQGFAEHTGSALLEKRVWLVIRDQFFNRFPELRIASRGALDKGGTSLRRRLLQSLKEDFVFAGHLSASLQLSDVTCG